MAAPASIACDRVVAQANRESAPDPLRVMLVEMVNLLMSAEVDAVCGAGYRERSEERGVPGTRLGHPLLTRVQRYPSRPPEPYTKPIPGSAGHQGQGRAIRPANTSLHEGIGQDLTAGRPDRERPLGRVLVVDVGPLVRMPGRGRGTVPPSPTTPGGRSTNQGNQNGSRTEEERVSSEEAGSSGAGGSSVPVPRRAMRVPKALMDAFARNANSSSSGRAGVKLSPTSSTWRDLLAASAGYESSRRAPERRPDRASRISARSWSRRRVDGDDAIAIGEPWSSRRSWGLPPEVRQARSSARRHRQNVLMQDFGVPKDRLETTLQHIKEKRPTRWLPQETPDAGCSSH